MDGGLHVEAWTGGFQRQHTLVVAALCTFLAHQASHNDLAVCADAIPAVTQDSLEETGPDGLEGIVLSTAELDGQEDPADTFALTAIRCQESRAALPLSPLGASCLIPWIGTAVQQLMVLEPAASAEVDAEVP